MFCPYCGKEIDDGVKFCPSCGKSIKKEGVENEGAEKEAPKQKKSIVPIIIGCLALLFLIVMAVVGIITGGRQLSNVNRRRKEEKRIEKELLKNQWDGDYYIGEDGKYVKNTWEKYGDDWYYCGEDGKILKNQWIDETYYVDDMGKMMINTYTPDGYFVGEDGKYVEGITFNSTLQSARTSPLLQKARDTINRIDPTYAGKFVSKIAPNGNVYCHANYVDTVSWDERTYRYKRQTYSENPSSLEKEANDYLFVFYKDVGTVKMYRIYNIVNKTDPTLAYSIFNSPDRVQVTKWNYEGSLQGDGGEKYNNYLTDLATFNSIK